MEKFLIFGLERSGTTSLAALLSYAAPLVHEPFSSLSGDVRCNARFRRILERHDWLPEHLEEVSEDDYRFNRFHFLGLCRRQCGRFLGEIYAVFTGVKHVWNPLSRQANLNILDWCFEHDIRLVFHTRKSLGRSLLSRLLAQQAGIHNLGDNLEQKSRWEGSIFQAIDVGQFEEQLGYLRDDHAAYVSHLGGRAHHVLHYEDLFAPDRTRQSRALEALCSFLGCAVADLPSEALDQWLFRRDRRQISAGILERIPNLEEFRHLL